MCGGKVLTLALFIAVQAASQDMSKVLSYVAPQEWKTNPFASFTAAWPDAFQMFPYPVPEDGPSGPPEQAQCRFSGGKRVTVNYSTRHLKAQDWDYRLPYKRIWVTVFDEIKFTTDESLVTVKGIGVPAGDYTISAGPIFGKRGGWTLYMRGNNGVELQVPMSERKLASPAENSAISFEHTGGSCVMRVNVKNGNTQASVEFTETNTDLPVDN
jgi:hypothetical protein